MDTANQSLAQALVAWYRASHRMLPWRETQDPYEIWLSEVMLQQTQVATVLPYYARFLTHFPTIKSLAHAPIDSLLKQWEGLGYYARARNLQKAAQIIMDSHDGHFPDTFDAVHALPGIGQSTAGAILTFAFRKPHPILDGNVKRVLSRLIGLDRPTGEPESLTALWAKSESLLPQAPDDAYDFNQALMELGATLCTPKKPDCPRCPWADGCVAKATDQQHHIPVKVAAKPVPHHTIGVGVIWRDDKILIALRPAEGLLGGLWEFPGGKCGADESLQDCIRREVLEETGLPVEIGARIAVVKHAYTHFKITLHAYHCETTDDTVPMPKASQALQWVTLDTIDQYAFPKANKTVLAALHSNAGRQLTFC